MPSHDWFTAPPKLVVTSTDEASAWGNDASAKAQVTALLEAIWAGRPVVVLDASDPRRRPAEVDREETGVACDDLIALGSYVGTGLNRTSSSAAVMVNHR